MLDYSERGAPASDLQSWLQREEIGDEWGRGRLADTYQHLCDLRAAGRDHIWGYVVRNQARPVWLSTNDQRADVIIGNPPWLAYRYMSRAMQRRFREESRRRNLWAGGNVATHQDLSAYFYACCAELYAKPGGTLAFVLPYATLHRKQYEGFRSGVFGEGTWCLLGPQFGKPGRSTSPYSRSFPCRRACSSDVWTQSARCQSKSRRTRALCHSVMLHPNRRHSTLPTPLRRGLPAANCPADLPIVRSFARARRLFHGCSAW